MLTELKNFSPPKKTVFLFPSKNDAMKPISRAVYDRRFRKSVKKANLTSRGFSLHSTRRGLITRLHEAGYSLAIIQQVTGHRDLNSLKQYIEINPEATSKAIEDLDL
ncbi:MAG: phage integrase family protein [Okeania sp. SIO3I5]|uniref:tyrosine-type recombinase/integrase n=1 Tax=Okeania sp. SIO3I5 TaxID=2607805 RepID=UPI0013BA0D30|nr:tyrosine-type recombinase/integrase [Okeania sp. SIO3I5]NEQ39565.1 phage integrase family protein [Okeania sp. SIO3I5]